MDRVIDITLERSSTPLPGSALQATRAESGSARTSSHSSAADPSVALLHRDDRRGRSRKCWRPRTGAIASIIISSILLSSHAALAHGVGHALEHAATGAGAEPSIAPSTLWSAWSFDPLVVILLLISGALYVRGLMRLWREASPGRGVRRWEAACYAAGWLALAVALISPLHPLGEVLFSAHMTQHEALMLLAAPLLVLGRPLLPFLWALPIGWRSRLGRIANKPAFARPWRLITAPLAAWLIHAAALWIWHLPILFQATLTSDLVHTLQHLSFLLSALLFSWSLLHGPGGRMSYGGAVLYIFTTALHSSILGALLTFSHAIWYPAYAGGTAAWGLTPIEDQQLGGLIMWVPAGVIYLAAGLILFAAWIRTSDQATAPYQITNEAGEQP